MIDIKRAIFEQYAGYSNHRADFCSIGSVFLVLECGFCSVSRLKSDMPAIMSEESMILNHTFGGWVKKSPM
jgi:hypothetical protein